MDVFSHPFLKDFSPGPRGRLVASLVHEDYSDGAFLFREGDAADGIYLVVRGSVEIVLSAGKQQKIITLVPAGDYFGEVAVLDGRGRSTAARARGELSVAKVPRDVLLEILATEPGTLALNLFRHVLSHLRNANDLVVSEVVHKEKLSLVGEMASSLMHDLRTPLSCIRMGADLINSLHHEENITQWCDSIRLQCERVVGMAEDLMDFSRGDPKLALGKTTTAAFLEQFKVLNAEYLAAAGVPIHIEADPADIQIDSMRLQRVLLNLVSNAVDALRTTPSPRIDVKARVSDAVFQLTVTDNGPGIPPEIRETIFEPFVTHGKSNGTGLGMAIVRNIVTAHGGTVSFETAANAGTKFLIRIPQKR